MSRGCATVWAFSTLLLAGCGSASRPARHEASSEQVASECGTLNARMRGIETIEDIDDPQPGTLRGKQPARRVSRASVEAALASHAAVARLRAIGAPAASVTAVTLAEREYARYADVARSSFARTARQGLHVELGYLKLVKSEVEGCFRAARGD